MAASGNGEFAAIEAMLQAERFEPIAEAHRWLGRKPLEEGKQEQRQGFSPHKRGGGFDARASGHNMPPKRRKKPPPAASNGHKDCDGQCSAGCGWSLDVSAATPSPEEVTGGGGSGKKARKIEEPLPLLQEHSFDKRAEVSQVLFEGKKAVYERLLQTFHEEELECRCGCRTLPDGFMERKLRLATFTGCMDLRVPVRKCAGCAKIHAPSVAAIGCVPGNKLACDLANTKGGSKQPLAIESFVSDFYISRRNNGGGVACLADARAFEEMWRLHGVKESELSIQTYRKALSRAVLQEERYREKVTRPGTWEMPLPPAPALAACPVCSQRRWARMIADGCFKTLSYKDAAAMQGAKRGESCDPCVVDEENVVDNTHRLRGVTVGELDAQIELLEQLGASGAVWHEHIIRWLRAFARVDSTSDCNATYKADAGADAPAADQPKDRATNGLFGLVCEHGFFHRLQHIHSRRGGEPHNLVTEAIAYLEARGIVVQLLTYDIACRIAESLIAVADAFEASGFTGSAADVRELVNNLVIGTFHSGEPLLPNEMGSGDRPRLGGHGKKCLKNHSQYSTGLTVRPVGLGMGEPIEPMWWQLENAGKGVGWMGLFARHETINAAARAIHCGSASDLPYRLLRAIARAETKLDTLEVRLEVLKTAIASADAGNAEGEVAATRVNEALAAWILARNKLEQLERASSGAGQVDSIFNTEAGHTQKVEEATAAEGARWMALAALDDSLTGDTATIKAATVPRAVMAYATICFWRAKRDHNAVSKQWDEFRRRQKCRQVVVKGVQEKVKRRLTKRMKNLRTKYTSLATKCGLDPGAEAPSDVEQLRCEQEEAKQRLIRCEEEVDLRIEEFNLLVEWQNEMMAHMQSLGKPDKPEVPEGCHIVRNIVVEDLEALCRSSEDVRTHLERRHLWTLDDRLKMQKLKKDSRDRPLLSSLFSLTLRPRMDGSGASFETLRRNRETPECLTAMELRARRLARDSGGHDNPELRECVQKNTGTSTYFLCPRSQPEIDTGMKTWDDAVVEYYLWKLREAATAAAEAAEAAAAAHGAGNDQPADDELYQEAAGSDDDDDEEEEEEEEEEVVEEEEEEEEDDEEEEEEEEEEDDDDDDLDDD